MARMARVEVFSPEDVAVVHVMNRVVRRCFLLGQDPVTGKNYDHRKVWIEDQLRKLAAGFGIDLLGFAILSNHFHLILRSRPDCVEKWDDTEIARRWLTLCPVRKDENGQGEEPNEAELNSIRNDPDRLKLIRSRLSDISWWMRLLCHNIALRANREDEETGRFFTSRFRAVRLLDEQALAACAAYVDLNPIRAAIAESLETSDFTSARRRIQAINYATSQAEPVKQEIPATSSESAATSDKKAASRPMPNPDRFLSPLPLNERTTKSGPVLNKDGTRCSDKGFLPMSSADYLDLLDWTGRQLAKGKRGRIPHSVTPILKRLSLDRHAWCDLVKNFGKRFFHVAGTPSTIDSTISRVNHHRYHVPSETRKLFHELNSQATAKA